MIIITRIVLTFNALSALLNFFGVFIGKTTADRIVKFMGCTINILTCILSIYILKL